MANKKHNWLLIVLGVVILVVILGLAAVVGFGYFMYHQMEITRTTTGDLEQQFTEVRTRFEGQVPFIDLANLDEGKAVVHHEQEKDGAQRIEHLRLVAYDPDEKQLVRVTIPMWLLRFAKNKPISFGDHARGFRWDNDAKLDVTPAQIEKHGPGLIVDTTGRHGERVLIWAE